MALAIAILGFLAPAIPPLAKWLAGRASGYKAWKSEITYWVGRPRSLRRFLGRGAELKAISNAFRQGDSVALSGGPGTGKSQLAAEFARNSKRRGFWTPGGETTDQTLRALAPHLGIQPENRSEDEILFQTRRRLQGLPPKTLWVIDNLPSLEQLNTLLNDAGCPCGPINSMDQVFADPQVKHLKMAVAVDHPILGKFEIVNQAVKLSRTPSSIRTATPEQGEHTDDILEELGYTAEEINGYHTNGVV